MSIAADTLHEVAFVPSWAPVGPIGRVAIRRLEDRVDVAGHAVEDEEAAAATLARVEADLAALDAPTFEAAHGILEAADAGPDVLAAGRPGGGTAPPPLPDPHPGERVRAGDPRVRVLPEGVLAPPLPALMDALLAIDLSALDPALTGRVPLVSPVEPESGLLGEDHAPADPHTAMNWLAFTLDGGRLSLLNDPALFVGPEGDPALYAARPRPRVPAVLLDLGGDPGAGNWTAFPPPSAYRLEGAALTRDGAPFVFVGATAGHAWRDGAADAILVFYEPISATVLTTFDWS